MRADGVGRVVLDPPIDAASTGIRAILWDADGVLQHSPGDWRAELDAAGGPGFAQAVFLAEMPALRGEEQLRAALQRVVQTWPQSTMDLDDIVGLWERAVVDDDALALVADVRAQGITCFLATNQQDHRRAWMRDELGLDEHFDEVFYSAELGAMKPDPAFFVAILERLGLPPEQVGFVDDSHANVATALALGIRGVVHDPASGSGVLRAEIAALLADQT